MPTVALFPIPDCVAFPGTIFPLHVFEPRYREMINYCLEENMLMGITHTEALISPSPTNQTTKQAMQSNQATYKPYSIFSAGEVELIETLEDGRMLIDVHLKERLYAIKQTQQLPYLIYDCDEYQDRPISDDELEQSQVLQQKLLNRLIALTHQTPAIQQQLDSPIWHEMDVVEFSFKLFGLVRLEGDISQQILQCRSPVERLHIALQMLNKITPGII